MSARAGEFFRQRIINFMFNGCQFILRYAEFVTPFLPATFLALNMIMTRTRFGLLVS